jgi:hypothetical protein
MVKEQELMTRIRKNRPAPVETPITTPTETASVPETTTAEPVAKTVKAKKTTSKKKS